MKSYVCKYIIISIIKFQVFSKLFREGHKIFLGFSVIGLKSPIFCIFLSMEYTGNIRKMHSVLLDTVQYELPVGNHLLPLNEVIGCNISMEYLHSINCIKCGRKTKKSFAQGYCYPCFISAPETEATDAYPICP